jgi:16S rRNA A1518/A1519 N6-dimethyltransferase RsmA/KsgA/DIM1 with predicted DNA glycosylase/AP lyase activity
VLRARWADEPRFTLVEGDVLEQDLGALAGGPYLLAGNVPYNITTPILFHAMRRPRPARAVYLVQKEVADRIVAPPDSDDYGALSVNGQALAKAELLFGVSAKAFHPPPKGGVGGGADHAARRSGRARGREEPFRLFVQGAFGLRRKLRRVLRTLWSLDAAQADAVLERAGVGGDVRPGCSAPTRSRRCCGRAERSSRAPLLNAAARLVDTTPARRVALRPKARISSSVAMFTARRVTPFGTWIGAGAKLRTALIPRLGDAVHERLGDVARHAEHRDLRLEPLDVAFELRFGAHDDVVEPGADPRRIGVVDADDVEAPLREAAILRQCRPDLAGADDHDAPAPLQPEDLADRLDEVLHAVPEAALAEGPERRGPCTCADVVPPERASSPLRWCLGLGRRTPRGNGDRATPSDGGFGDVLHGREEGL